MARKKQDFNQIKNNAELNVIKNVDENKLTKEQFYSVSKHLFKLNKDNKIGFRKLNRQKNAKVYKESDIFNKIDKAERDGFFRLESFADCYRTTIKISYCSLRTRIISHPILLQYLIDNDLICLYIPKGKAMIIVNFEKRFEFIDLILKSFLSDSQLQSVIK